jgi:hypothetical protein
LEIIVPETAPVNLTPTWLEEGLVDELHAATSNQTDAATARRSGIRR